MFQYKITMFKKNVPSINFMELTPLSESQSRKIGQLLDKAIQNKDHPHPQDIRRAAVVLYSTIQRGFSIADLDVHQILDQSGGYSDSMKTILGNMANAYEELAYGLAEPGIDSYKFKVVNKKQSSYNDTLDALRLGMSAFSF
jgi:hypothetical protein